MNNTHPNERTAQLMWTGIILMFFLIQAAIWTYAISITAGDSSHTVVAGYDEQALRWDEVKKMRQDSTLLGWDANVLVDTTGDIRGNRVVTLKLVDRERRPLENAKVELKAYHRGTAAEVQGLTLKEVAPGVYSTSVQVTKSGQWQFSGSATRGDNQFLIEHRTALTKASSISLASPRQVKN